MRKVMFVCLGNICRSPVAHAVMDHLVDQNGMSRDVLVESAGTGNWHVGHPADARMRETAQGHGVEITSLAQQFTAYDGEHQDLIFAMDRSNHKDILSIIQVEKDREKVFLFREFDPEVNGNGLDVPDPYYGGIDGFEQVYQIVERTCNVIFQKIKSGEL